MPAIILVSGIPRAGKSSLCDAIEASGAGFTHVPLDRYVRPVPMSHAFLDWIADPACIDWPRLRSHLDILRSDAACYSPRPDWENGWRGWRCEGGAIPRGPGRRMEPARSGYLIAGTHAFALGAGMRVFVRTPDVVVAERLMGARLDAAGAYAVIRDRLAPNLAEIARGAETAHLVIDGTARRRTQLRHLLNAHARYLRSGGTEGVLHAAPLVP
jgi:hypothetical protein